MSGLFLGERGDLVRLLARRERRVQDLSVWDYAGPNGPQLHFIRHPTSGQILEVPSLLGPKTWAIGAKVTVAQPGGRDHAIAGGPTGGNKGSAAFARRTYPAAPPSPDMIAFAWEGGFLRRWLYRGGAWVGDLGKLAGAVTGTHHSLIRVDSAGVVGPASLTWLSDSTAQLFVADIAGGELYSYDVPPGRVVGGAAYADGLLWWIEREEVASDGDEVMYQLRSSPADLSEVSTGTPFAVIGNPGNPLDWSAPRGFFLTPTGAILADGWVDGSSDTATTHYVRLPRAGGDGSSAPDSNPGGWSDVEGGLDAVGIPGPGGSLFCASGESGGSLRRIGDDLALADIWPAAPPWLAADGTASLSADLSRASLYSPGTLVRSPVTIGDAVPEVFTVSAHPSVGVLPALMFLRS